MQHQNKSVLVIDDYATMVRIITRMLNELEFGEVHGAKDGAEGLAKFRDKRYDLVVCDWNMEGVRGEDVVRAWKREPDLRSAVLLVVCADHQAKAALSLEPDGILVKPFNVATLRTKIAAAFERRNSLVPPADRGAAT